jgi:hypothetical protein
VLFLYVFLRLRLWHAFLAVLFAGWVAGQLGLVGLAVIGSRLPAGLSRLERPRPPTPPPGTPPAPNPGLRGGGGNVGMKTTPNYADLDQDQRERRRLGQSGGV